eukprot:TRINITY_DN75944_c0_g1_i1.p1 TRINITY_DN75944_c0_g1~~TRINITY_DN75944_c0_g1_i1.p1  ORF type:complete len:285 (-),score=20.00 TRINITY_DN75944_c0_g1_i1:45-899(-)
MVRHRSCSSSFLAFMLSTRAVRVVLAGLATVGMVVYYNWALTVRTGQYVGYKTLTSKTRLEVFLDQQPDTSWHGQSQFILDHMETHKLPATVERFVVDIGAHDGHWLSNSFPFIQRGFGGLLVEGSPRNFQALRENLRDYLGPVLDGSSKGVTAVNELVGQKRGTFAKIVDEGGWWDGTEAKVVPCSSPDSPGWEAGCRELKVIGDLLAANNVPKNFAMLTMDMESQGVFYDKAMKNIVGQGYRPVYVILELNPSWSKKIESLGYVSLGRWHYDEVFYYAASDR